MTDVLDAALAFHHAGICVIPAAATGTKQPWPDGPRWKQYQAQQPDEQQLRAWFTSQYTGLGIVCGTVSGGIDMLEFEGRAVAEGYFEQARDIAEAAGIGDVWRRFTSGYMEFSPSGGLHFPYRLDGQPVPGNTKLAERPAFDHELTDRERADVADRAARGIDYWPKRTLMETRGEGGFTVVAPSHGAVHPTGKPWILPRGSIATIPVLTADEHKELYRVIRSLDQMPAPAAPSPFAQPGSPERELVEGELKPGEDFNQRAGWMDELLGPVGWKLVSTARDGTSYIRRPDKAKGISATINKPPHRNLYVFSTSTEFPDLEPISKFRAYAILNHGGDDRAAARALRAQDYGTPLPAGHGQLGQPPPFQPPPFQAPQFQQPTPVSAAAAADQAPAAAAALPGALPDFDLGALAAQGISEPQRIAGGMLYPSAVHCIAGTPGGGKTTIAAWWMLTHIRDGGHVMLLDEESGPEQAAEKFLDLGATPDELRPPRLTYVPFPARAWTTADLAHLHTLIVERKPGIVTWDSAAAFLAIAGQDENSATDVTAFWQKVLVPVARQHGAAVVAIDHTVKTGDAAGFGRGSGAKKAASDVQYMLETVKPFNRGQDGILRLTTAPGKDRRGWLAGAYEIYVKTGAEIQLDVNPVTTAAFTGEAPLAGAKAKLWEALSAIATEEQPVTSSQLVDWIARRYGHGLKRQTASTNLNQLAAAGLADSVTDRPGREKLWYGLATSSDNPRSDPSAGDGDTSGYIFQQPSGRAARNRSSGYVSASDDASALTRQAASAPPEGADDDGDTPTRHGRTTRQICHCGELLPHQGRPCQDPGAAA